LRCENRAGLVFVSLADDPPPLADYLGPFATWCDESYAEPFRFVWRWDKEYPSNWKVPLENSLEGYHISCIHPKTFGEHPPEADTDHILDERFSTLHAREPAGIARTMQNWLVRRLGRQPRNIYTHSLLHPNLIFIGMDVMKSVQVFLPTSPTTTRHLILVYALRGTRRGPLSYLFYRLLRSLVIAVTRKIASEDQTIFRSQQQGLSASQHPGVIGTLEERVYVFQDFIRRSVR
jgi:phenylpropionate dioxygenase-like ring-hydroxylating dioxygenase large terminal subunit